MRCRAWLDWTAGGGCSHVSLVNIQSLLGDVQGALDRAALSLNFFLQESDGVDQLLRTRRAARNIYIDGNNLVYTLHQSVIVEHAARGRAGSHRDYPFGFRHLLPELADDWSHFIGDAAGNDDEVRLPRRRTKHFSSEAGDVEARRAHGHHFDRAARQAEGHRPNGVFAHPVDRVVHRGQHHTFGGGIPVSQVFDDAFAVFNGDVGAEVEVAAHNYILLASPSPVQT